MEASTLIAVFGEDKQDDASWFMSSVRAVAGKLRVVRVSWIRTWLGEERLPEGFIPRSGDNLASTYEFAKAAAAIKWQAGLF